MAFLLSTGFVNTFVLALLRMLTNPILIIFASIIFGYLIGKITIKGVSFGSAGVFVSALAFGILFGLTHTHINSFAARFQSPVEVYEYVRMYGYVFNDIENVYERVFLNVYERVYFYQIPRFIGWLSVNANDHVVAAANFTAFRTFGLVFFIAGVGLIAGPTFFRNFKKSGLSFVTMGVAATATGAVLVIILIATGAIDDPAMATGLLMGALSTTPGLAAAQEAFPEHAAIIATANGIAYPFGVLGIVLFVQLLPKFMRKDMDAEREKLKKLLESNTEVNAVATKVEKSEETSMAGSALPAEPSLTTQTKSGEAPAGHPSAEGSSAASVKEKKLITIDKLGLGILAGVIITGMLIGALSFRIGATIALGTVGGILIMGLLAGHFGKIGRVSLEVPDKTAKLARELGLIVFLAVVGFEGGLNFVTVVAGNPMLFVWGMLMTMGPIIVAFLIGHFIFKMALLSNLGGVTGSMTSTPGLGALIHGSKTEDVGFAYAAAYPVALLTLIFVPLIVTLIF